MTNVVYTGRVCYQGTIYEGEHEGIIDDVIWNKAQAQLNRNGRRGGRNAQNRYGALLKGLVRCGGCGTGMTHTYVAKNGTKIYRYYVCINAHQRGWNKCSTRSVSAPALEEAVVRNIRNLARTPVMLSEVLQQLGRESRDTDGGMVDAGDLKSALEEFDPLWDLLKTSEKERALRALVREVKYDGVDGSVLVSLRSAGLKQLCQGESIQD